MEGGDDIQLNEQQLIGLQLHGLPEDLDDFDMLVNLPAGFRARIGLNETTLTRALARGDFALAEKLIEEATDVEYLNDGALSATPLNMVLTGRSSFFHQSRNLKLALLLMQKGANPNLRIPNHDMESASESPIELLLRYYLKLIEVFGVPGSGHCRTSYRPNSFEETELMDTVGINGEIGGMGPGQITSQARQLLFYCLENGGDSNLPTTDAAKSIYHMAVVAPVSDHSLVARMLELGANVNLADVHNTTPLMDVIMIGDERRALAELTSMESAGRSLLLDSQNCSLQCALWRSLFQGHLKMAEKLLKANSNEVCSARVEPLSRPATRIPRQPTIKSAVPGLLAPFVNDSPCTANLNVRLPRKRTGRTNVEFSALAAIHIGRTTIAPLIDKGYFLDPTTADLTSTLIRLNTDHTQAGDGSVVDSKAIIPLMFGELSGGLRQLAVRTIMRHMLFTLKHEETIAKIDAACERNGFMIAQMLVKPSMAKLATQEDTMIAHEYEIELGSEMELSFGFEQSETSTANKSEINNVELGISEIAISEYPLSNADELSVSDSSYLAETRELPNQREVPEDSNTPTDEEDESVTDIFETIKKLDRELEVIKTDSVLQTLDRDLAAWEVELQGTLDRIQRYQAELNSGDLIRDVRFVRKERDRGIEEARLRSEQLMEELRVQRNILLKSDSDMAQCETFFEGNAAVESKDHVVPSSLKLNDSEATRETRMNLSSMESLYWDNRRRQIDENWSLGAERVLADEAEYSESDVVPADGRSLDEILSSICPMCLDVYHGTHDCIAQRPSIVQPLSVARSSPTMILNNNPNYHTEHLVQTLSVSVSVNQASATNSLPPLADSELSSDTESNSWFSNSSTSTSHANRTVARTSPETMANNLALLNERLFQQRRRIGAAAISLVDQVQVATPPPLTPSPPPMRDPFTTRMPGFPSFRSPPIPPQRHGTSPLLSATTFQSSTTISDNHLPGLSVSSESEPESDNSSDTDTWGGTFSLRHTRRQVEHAEPPLNDATIVSRLTPRTLYALTDSLGIPNGLRPCFSVEAARLQLTLSLFNHQSILCDRNCEGDESDSDSEEDWLVTDSDTEEDTAEENDVDPAPLTDSESFVSDFSQRSWFGSQAELTEARRLSPRSTFSPPLSESPRSLSSESDRSLSSQHVTWLPDTEDLRRVREFLDSSPGPGFNHSTDSDSESSGI